MAFDEAVHPRGATGTATGGQFVVASSGPAAAPSKTAKKGSKRGGGSMSYDPKSKRGTGYGKKGGDPRVRKLQALLNKLGLKDAKGRPLAVDGQLGPLTTQAIKAAQRKHGMKADGVVTPALIKALGKPHMAKSKLQPKSKSFPKKRNPNRVAPSTPDRTKPKAAKKPSMTPARRRFRSLPSSDQVPVSRP